MGVNAVKEPMEYALNESADFLSSIEEVIEEARNGRMFILVDDENRENEGDLVIPAQMATPEAINFMAKHGRGLICLSLTLERVDELGLPLMAQHNESRHQTAFTVSIEAKEGVSTGISVADRAHTIAVAIDPTKGRSDIGIPGHVFPLVANDGGTLVRAGHTEAAIDIARLAGLNPSGVICEIMNDDGTMARLPDLLAFAQLHGLKVATIADLIAYRLRHDTIVRRTVETTLHSKYGGDFSMMVFINSIDGAEHVALVMGDVTTSDPVLTRVHVLSVFEDVLGGRGGERGGELEAAMRAIGAAGRGVLVLIREVQQVSLSESLKARGESDTEEGDLREVGIGSQILLALGVHDMILLSNNKRTIIGLEGYGLSVVGQQALEIDGA
ncbi:MAG: 3,4-dihydroxy-2-butanone-4-phosphate synthase [Proteobacteria bacterium]|nr:3,4-dihydroxy-2-butanone-4-phosphate synthase [Pseudomonadota bacterium]